MPAVSVSPGLERAPLGLIGDPFLEALAELRGVDFALDFARSRGGRRMYVGSRGGGALERLVGESAARVLARDWGGLHVEIGHATRARIARMALRGESVSTIAHESGRSRRYVRAQLARARRG